MDEFEKKKVFSYIFVNFFRKLEFRVFFIIIPKEYLG